MSKVSVYYNFTTGCGNDFIYIDNFLPQPFSEPQVLCLEYTGPKWK
jgi:hypothetical protein